MDILNSLDIIYLNPITNSEIFKTNINLERLDSDILLTFNEYTKVEITLNCENKNAFIRTLDVYKGQYIETTPNIKLELTSGAENKNYLPPGEYPIFIDLGFKKINKIFKVIPNTLNTEDYSEILKYLESKENGITKINKINKDNKINFTKEKKERHFNLNYLIENEEKIINAINLVIKNPILEEEISYTKTKPSKLNKKAINNMLRKGLDINNYNNFYEDRKIQTINNINNENIRFLIEDIYSLLKENKISIEEEIEDINNRLSLKEEELINLRKKLETAIDNIYLSENTKTNRKTNFMLSKTYIKRKKSKIYKLKELYDYLTKFEMYLESTINTTWLKEVKPNNRINNKLKNPYYINLYQIYKRLYDLDNEVSITKPTSTIYENYSLLKIIESLEGLGFTLTKCNAIKSNSTILFTKNEYKIVIDIEKEISKELKDKEESQFISINSKHCTPDINLTLFKDDKIIKSIIFEVKCRKQRYLYSNQGDTSVIEQLKDYLSFAYYDSETRSINRDIIQEVVVLYPIQHIEYEYESFLNINFCQLGELNETNLNKKIEDFLNKNSN